MLYKKYVRNALCIAAIVAFSGCSWVLVPTLPYGTPFPREKAPHTKKANWMAADCVNGEYTGKNVKDLLRDSRYEEVIKNPDGTGKIYKIFLTYSQGVPGMQYKNLFGYSFTIHTDDSDIIKECTATEQLLGLTD